MSWLGVRNHRTLDISEVVQLLKPRGATDDVWRGRYLAGQYVITATLNWRHYADVLQARSQAA